MDARHDQQPERNAGDGRNIDPATGILEGEASEQVVPTRRAFIEGSPEFDVWTQGPPIAADGKRAAEPTYYDRPAIKEPVWIWAVPAYFYAGGAAGAAAALGAVAQGIDRRGMATLIERCRWVAGIGGGIGTGLLIYDLGRPERFLNMLRVFRPTSPLNLGSWILAGATPASSGAAALSHADGLLGALGDVGGMVGGSLGVPLAGYTAVLLSNTSVPLWQETRRTLPALFYASAVSSAACLLDLFHLNRREIAVVNRFGNAGKAAELALAEALERDAFRIPEVGAPLRHGVSGALWRGAKALTGASLAVSSAPGTWRWKRALSGVLGTAGAIALRFALFQAGKVSARDPRTTFRQQRQGHGAEEVTGQSAIAGPRGIRATSQESVVAQPANDGDRMPLPDLEQAAGKEPGTGSM
ncbi:MAG TPA: NrfD/PsrC family molybdoenzyme membrane anchor subunit [Actinomycetota bacterium]|jgi:hypothetical protein|nr:NrfD/PsrC family molybdoenzyme membrane anchor subunit [Actinomycetota bacterium]